MLGPVRRLARSAAIQSSLSGAAGTVGRVPDPDRLPLTAADLETYRERGVLRVPSAFPREAALEVQDILWSDVERRLQVRRGDPASWRAAPYWTGFQSIKSALGRIVSPQLTGALDHLLGAGTWRYPKQWGGLLVGPPADPSTPWTLTDRNWHWDGPPLVGCLFFALFADLPPRSGGTLLVEGSGPLLQDWFEALPPEAPRKQRSMRHQFLASHPFLRRLSGRDPVDRDPDDLLATHVDAEGRRLRVTEVSGEAGDVIVCHSNVVHAAPVHTGTAPRFLCIRHLDYGPLARRAA